MLGDGKSGGGGAIFGSNKNPLGIREQDDGGSHTPRSGIPEGPNQARKRRESNNDDDIISRDCPCEPQQGTPTKILFI